MHPFSIPLIVLAIRITISLAGDKFDLYFILNNGEEDKWEHILQNCLPLSYYHNVKIILNFSNTSLLQNVNHLKQSPRPEILLISNLSLLFSTEFKDFVDPTTEYIFVFMAHLFYYNYELSDVWRTSKIIYFGQVGIFIPCFPCRTFTFVNKHIFSFNMINSIWHRQKRDQHAGKHFNYLNYPLL